MALPIVITMVTIKNVAMISMFTAATVSFITGAIQDVKRTELEKGILQEKLNANIRALVEEQVRLQLKQREAQSAAILKEEAVVMRAYVQGIIIEEISKAFGHNKPVREEPLIVTG